MLTACYQSVSF